MLVATIGGDAACASFADAISCVIVCPDRTAPAMATSLAGFVEEVLIGRTRCVSVGKAGETWTEYALSETGSLSRTLASDDVMELLEVILDGQKIIATNTGPENKFPGTEMPPEQFSSCFASKQFPLSVEVSF
jgi:hypothetical protein